MHAGNDRCEFSSSYNSEHINFVVQFLEQNYIDLSSYESMGGLYV